MARRYDRAAVIRFIGLINRAYVAAGSPRLRLTTWGRTLEHATFHGEPNSQHVVLTAIDTAPTNATWRAAVRSVGLVAIDEGDHDHVQLFRRGEGPHL